MTVTGTCPSRSTSSTARWGRSTVDDDDLRYAPDIGRRTLRLLRPWRWQLVAVSLFILGQAGLMTAGPALDQLRHRRGCGEGRRRRRSPFASVALRRRRRRRLRVRPGRDLRRVDASARRSCSTCASACSTTSWSMSMGFFDRTRTGLLVSRMTADVEALQDLISQGLAVFVVSARARDRHAGRHAAAELAARAGRARCSARVLVVATICLPARVEPCVPPRARPRGRHAHRAAGGLGRRARDPGVRPDRPTVSEFVSTSHEQYRTSVGAERITAVYNGGHPARAGCDARAHHRARCVLRVRGRRHGRRRHRVRALPQQPVRADPAAHAGVQHVPAGGRRAAQALRTPRRAHRPRRARRHRLRCPPSGDLVVERVSFRYAPQLPPVLRDVSLALEHGKRLVLVGPTGAGKSTLAKLMARLYDPTDGAIRFGGVDLRSVDEDVLRQPHRRDPAGGLPLHRHDPRQPPDRSTRRRRRRASAPRSTTSVLPQRFARFPDGLDTHVETRGTNFSAGERQLVSVARAALVDPSVLVLDEATSSLDPGTELLLDRALERLMAGRIGRRHRPPPHDRRARRPGGRGRRGAPRRGRHPRGARRARGPLRRAVRVVVRPLRPLMVRRAAAVGPSICHKGLVCAPEVPDVRDGWTGRRR